MRGPVADVAARRQVVREPGRDLAGEAVVWGLLAGGVAHDLKNVLCGMMGTVDLALLEAGEDDQVRQYLAELRHFTDQAVALTDQMLSHSRHTGRAPELVDLNSLVLETARLTGADCEAASRLRCDLAPTLPLLRANRVQMVQVTLNLVLNALEATSDSQGAVVVRTGMTDIGDKPSGGPGTCLFLEVCDEGCGIAEDVLDRIFDPLFSTKPGGSGLGLATVARIVEDHEGRVEVVSKPGRGSVFRVLLPVC